MSRKIACLTLDMEPDYGDPDGHIRLLENPDYFERYTDYHQQVQRQSDHVHGYVIV